MSDSQSKETNHPRSQHPSIGVHVGWGIGLDVGWGVVCAHLRILFSTHGGEKTDLRGNGCWLKGSRP